MAPVVELFDYLKKGIWFDGDAFTSGSPLGATTRLASIQTGIPVYTQNPDEEQLLIGDGYFNAGGDVLAAVVDGDNVDGNVADANGVGSMTYRFQVKGRDDIADDTLTLGFTLDNAQFRATAGQGFALFPEEFRAADADTIAFTSYSPVAIIIPATVTVDWETESTYKITIKSQQVFGANAKEAWFGTADDGREFTTVGTATSTSTLSQSDADGIAKMEAYNAAKATGQATVAAYNALLDNVPP